jgi:hypothetical protein
MALQLYFKRSKVFYATVNGVEQRFQGNASNSPVLVPDWVVETLTYKHGVKDKSIIDLTPPKRAAVAVKADVVDGAPYAEPAAVGVDAVAALEEPASEVEAADEEEPILAASFGGSKGPARPKGLKGRQ